MAVSRYVVNTEKFIASHYTPGAKPMSLAEEWLTSRNELGNILQSWLDYVEEKKTSE